MPAANDDFSAALAAIWQRSIPATEQKLLTLARAAHAATAGTLSPQARAEAAAEAHKLAGSLGMLGFPRGSELAATLEAALAADTPLNGPELASTVAALRLELSL